jgi:UDP-N-acetylmuramoylalanine--D-glutamate ligase
MRALVIGAAVSGRAAARLLDAQGHEVIVYDRSGDAAEGVRAESRHSGAWDRQLLNGIDLVVVSPGVPEHAPPVADALAAGVTVWSEIELAARSIEAPMGAVTATNGKTTVTEIAALCLQRSGLRSAAVGNIGAPLSDAVDDDWDALVVEASSFQLRFIDSFHPVGAVLLNVAPDHLDWHGSLEAYTAAKQRVFEHQTADDVLVYDADDPGAAAAVASARSRLVPVSAGRIPATGGAGVTDGVLTVPMSDGTLEVPVDGLWRSDGAMLVDLAAGAALASHLGGTVEGAAAAIDEYRPGHHRRELVATVGGVAFVNDSKATNPHAAVAAIGAYPSVVLIAGGRAKGLDVSGLGDEPGVRHVVAIGEAAPAVLAGSAPGSRAADMDEAVAIAASVAHPGDTVLLAPGCASFDMFDSYGERGEAFAAAVRRLTGAA